MKKTPRYTERGFAPATHGGLAIELETEQGFFYVFGINRELADLDFFFSPDGKMVYDEIDYTKGYEVDIVYGDGTYDRLKLHLQQVVRELGLDEKARALYAEWNRKLDEQVEVPLNLSKITNISPELQKKLRELWNLEEDKK